MGSLVLRNFCIRKYKIGRSNHYGDDTGSAGQNDQCRFIDEVVDAFSTASMALSRDGKSGFGQHNRRFQPNRTAKDWLSSDPQQVDAYLADPHTQFHFSLSAYRDLFLLTKSECPACCRKSIANCRYC